MIVFYHVWNPLCLSSGLQTAIGLGWGWDGHSSVSEELAILTIVDCDLAFILACCLGEQRALSSRPVPCGEHRPGGRWKARESEQFTDRSLLVSYPPVSGPGLREAPSQGPPRFPQVIFVPAMALGALAITLSGCLYLVLPCNLPFASFLLGLLESPTRMWDRRGGSL